MIFYLRAGLLVASALFLPLILEGDTRERKIRLRWGRLSLFPERRGEDYGVQVQAGETSHFFPLRASERKPRPKALLKVLFEEKELLLDLLFLSISGWRRFRRCLSGKAEVGFPISDPALAGALYGWLSGLPRGFRALPLFAGEAFCRGEVRLSLLGGMVAGAPFLFSLPWGRLFRLVQRLRRSPKEDPVPGAPG